MKKIVLAFFIFSMMNISASMAQTKTAAKPKAAAAKGPSKSDSLMCGKEWHVTMVEEWGIAGKPGEKNKDDMLHMTLDGKYDLIMFGNKKAGTWTHSGAYIYFTDDATKGKFNYKILNVEATKLKVDHYSDEDGHSIFEYEPK